MERGTHWAADWQLVMASVPLVMAVRVIKLIEVLILMAQWPLLIGWRPLLILIEVL